MQVARPRKSVNMRESSELLKTNSHAHEMKVTKQAETANMNECSDCAVCCYRCTVPQVQSWKLEPKTSST